MKRKTVLATAMLSSLLLLDSGIATAQEDLKDHLMRKMQRLENLNNYVVRIKPVAFTEAAMGGDGCALGANCIVYDVVQHRYDGRVDRQMSALEVAALTGISPTAATVDAMGAGMLLGQIEMNERLTGKQDPTGGLNRVSEYLARKTYPAAGNQEQQQQEERGGTPVLDPWMDPFSSMGAGGLMLMDTATAMGGAEKTLAERREIAASLAQRQQAVLEQLERRGIEFFGGVEATAYETPNLPASIGETEDGQHVKPRMYELWIDHERSLSMGHRFEGTFTENGESRDFYIQTVNSDFRNPPGCHNMIQPFTRTVEMGGILNDEQKTQMEEAQKQLAEFDKQMAELPPSQRQMMERMMGDKMDAVRSMAESGALKYTMETEEILCNADLKALFSPPIGGPGVIQATGDGLLKQIQVDLTTLGYEPGNIDGVLDTMTQVAISQFEAEAGLAVTGEPSQEVAKALATAVGR
ncbi:MAG: peptidoglycan-binding domain-containing protein [Pseudomonadota bacterium]